MRPVFITSDERELKLHAVSQFALVQIRKAVALEFVKKGLSMTLPTYQMTTATGDIETAIHDDVSILDTDPETQASYKEIKANIAAAAQEENLRVVNYVLLEGLKDVEDPPADWLAKMKLFGVEVSEDPLEKRMLYLQTDVLKTPYDIAECAKQLMMLSLDGRPKEEIENMMGLFRNSVERS